MRDNYETAHYVRSHQHIYPTSHWPEIQRFIEGDECDPKGVFRLANDTWEAWRYAKNGRPTIASRYRFRFGPLKSWIKPYVKRYCYLCLTGSGKPLGSNASSLPYKLSLADRYIIEHRFTLLDDLALPEVFEALWNAQVNSDNENGTSLWFSASAVDRQVNTRSFWSDLSHCFHSPRVVPPVAPHKSYTPAEIGADKSKVIPDAVIRQLTNKLALHRSHVVRLNAYAHLRLCVVILMICLGRRPNEILGARRGKGLGGPLERYPCRDEGEKSEGALWFRFCPNKGGPSEWVYISPRWEDVVLYCVRELIRYGDQVRQYAPPGEEDLLILVSTWNWTRGAYASSADGCRASQEFEFRVQPNKEGKKRRYQIKKRTNALSNSSLHRWLNGMGSSTQAAVKTLGVLQEWNITVDGLADSQVYKMCLNYGRHTRQSVLARDSKISPFTRQRDLNHTKADMQFSYQHVLDEQNEALIAKVNDNPLHGQDKQWFDDLFEINSIDQNLRSTSEQQTGLVGLLTPRWRRLLESNASYFEQNRVDIGVCDTTDGTEECTQYKSRTRTRKHAVRQIAQPEKKRSNNAAVKLPKNNSFEDISDVNSSDVVEKLKRRRRQIEENGL